MSKPAALTFAIPFYRGQDYLRRAVASVLRQSYPHWNAIVCDDCGPESGTAELIASFGDRRIRYHRNETNLGMAGNWNRCLDLADSDLVNLLHADDEVLPCYAETMLDAAQRHADATAFCCRARIIDAHGTERFSLPDFVKRLLVRQRGQELILKGRTALESLLPGNYLMCPTMCYRRSKLAPRRFSTAWRFAQDLELFARLLLDGEKLVVLPTVAYAYRRHADNATMAYTRNLLRFEEEARLYDELSRTAALRGWNRAARLARRKSIVKLNLLYCAAGDLLHLRAKQAWRKVVFLRKLFVEPRP